jgi:hypothetical protein
LHCDLIYQVTCTADEHVSVSILGFLTHCSPETLSLVDQAHIQVCRRFHSP